MSKPYDFDDDFQLKIAALAVRDTTFTESTFGLIQPDYFGDSNLGKVVAVALDYFSTYRTAPSHTTYKKLLKDAVLANKIRRDQLPDVVAAYNKTLQADLSDRQFSIDEVTNFARHRATEQAILESVDLLNKGKIDDIEPILKEALAVGANQTAEYDYFAEIDNRAEIRKAQANGSVRSTGITTGVREIDSLLHNDGFGRRELSIFMGSFKSGKSFSLLHSAVVSFLHGYNVLFVTLENSKEITTERMDAYLSDTFSVNIKSDADLVCQKVKNALKSNNHGKLFIHEFPTATFKPMDLRRLLKYYEQKSIKFDMIVIDYLDLLKSDRKYQEARDESKSVWESIRGIAQEEDAAIVSATQSTREGATAGVISGDMVSSDINKVRIADLVISINRTEEEKRDGIARLYFAAGRNQADGVTIKIKQDLARAKFLTNVLEVY